MADALMIYCLVLAGPIAISATESASDGDFIELPQGDFDQLSRWGIVRRATEAEEKADKALKAAEIPPAPLDKGGAEPESESEPELGSAEVEEALPPPKETAAQKKKRLAEEAEAERLAAEEAAAKEAETERLAAEEAAAKEAETQNTESVN
jgi:hypothetical protein